MTRLLLQTSCPVVTILIKSQFGFYYTSELSICAASVPVRLLNRVFVIGFYFYLDKNNYLSW